MPKKVDHEERRRAFLEAAYRCIKRDGFAGMTVRAVAKEAGFTTGALTHYFQSKDELLIAASEAGADVVRPEMDDAATGASARAALRELLYTVLPTSAAMKAQWRFWIAFWERAAHSPQVQRVMRERYFEYTNRVAAVIRRSQEQGETPREIDAERVAREIIALIDGIGVQVMIGSRKFTSAVQREYVDGLLDLRLGPVPAVDQARAAHR